MIVPTLTLWVCMIALGVASVAAEEDPGSRTGADLAARIAFSLVIASWMLADARKRGRRLCYDYDSFAFFGWPIILPVYLFQTRGARAFLTLLCFAGLCVITMLAAAAALIIREKMSL